MTIGAGSVVNTTSIGSGSNVGADAYLQGSTFPANTHIPAGAIYVNNVFQGYVQIRRSRPGADDPGGPAAELTGATT